MTNLDSILKSRDLTLSTNVRLVKAMVFPVVLYGCELDYKLSWVPNYWCFWAVMLEKNLEIPFARRSNQSILKEISPEYSLEGLMLKLKLQYFGHLMWRTDSLEKTLMLRKIKGEGEDRGWDGWMASPIWWTWVRASSRTWWWTGKSAVFQSMESQRVKHDWVTELNWTECVYVNLNPLNYPTCVWRATGTLDSSWRHTACHISPAPSAPGHSSLGTKANQAPGIWHLPRLLCP